MISAHYHNIHAEVKSKSSHPDLGSLHYITLYSPHAATLFKYKISDYFQLSKWKAVLQSKQYPNQIVAHNLKLCPSPFYEPMERPPSLFSSTHRVKSHLYNTLDTAVVFARWFSRCRIFIILFMTISNITNDYAVRFAPHEPEQMVVWSFDLVVGQQQNSPWPSPQSIAVGKRTTVVVFF